MLRFRQQSFGQYFRKLDPSVHKYLYVVLAHISSSSLGPNASASLYSRCFMSAYVSKVEPVGFTTRFEIIIKTYQGQLLSPAVTMLVYDFGKMNDVSKFYREILNVEFNASFLERKRE